MQLSDARLYTDIRRSEGSKKAYEVQAKYRREGKYLEEILKEIKEKGVPNHEVR